MPAKRLSMREIKEILRPKWAQGLSNRRIAANSKFRQSLFAESLRRESGDKKRAPILS